MDINKILKFTRTYKGIFDERISTWLYRRFIKNKFYEGITWFEKEDIAIYYTSKEYIERRVWMLGEYEPEIKKIFEVYANNAITVLDIGANIGINSIRLANIVGDKGKVYAFEPIPFNQNRLIKNISLNKKDNIIVVPYALGFKNHTVTIEFNEHEENMGAITLRNPSEKGIEINVLNGDDWVQENKISKIDFMKIDVEGFEWNVIEGLMKTIKRDKPTILIEWDLNYMKETKCSLMEWQNFINDNQYKIYQVNRYDLIVINDLMNANDGNLLFV